MTCGVRVTTESQKQILVNSDDQKYHSPSPNQFGGGRYLQSAWERNFLCKIRTPPSGKVSQIQDI